MLHPFILLRPHANELDVALLTKVDDLHDDKGVARYMHADRIVTLHQVHGARTSIVRTPQRRTEDADGTITDTADLTLALRIADCQAFLIYAPTHRVVGLLHAGWRGLLAGAIPSFFATLQDTFGIDGGDVSVCVAPSLCLHCSEFTDPAGELPGIDPSFFHGRLVDLRGIADHQLHAAGVASDRIERHADCTKCNPARYWTYRGGDAKEVREGYENVLTARLLH